MPCARKRVRAPLSAPVTRLRGTESAEKGGAAEKGRSAGKNKEAFFSFCPRKMMSDFQSFAGPGDKGLRNTELEGYQPVSRIGETVINSFVDSFEFTLLEERLTLSEMKGEAKPAPPADDPVVEHRPMFHEWATATPGMICLARKKRTAVFRQFTAAETACPTIVCAACIQAADEKNYYFVGVARSKSVRSPDDGVGPAIDEFFTISVGGMVTCLNTSGDVIHPGDLLEWTLIHQKTSNARRPRAGPRRVSLQVASVSSPKVMGRALTFARAGESFDMLLKQ